MVVAGRSRLKESLPGVSNDRRTFPVTIMKSASAGSFSRRITSPAETLRHHGVRGERIDVIAARMFRKTAIPGGVLWSISLGACARHLARRLRPDENVARLFQSVCEDRCDALEQQIPETRLRLHQLHDNLAR